MIWIDGVLMSSGPGGVYGEKEQGGYRVWDPWRSKLAAFYHLGGGIELGHDMKVLYLGAGNGTTVSHVSDYVEVVYAVEAAPRPMQDLLAVAEGRFNIIPIMADARRPEYYAALLEEVDLIYQDVAQPDQAGIASANRIFLKEGGTLLLMLKTRSVDVRKPPSTVLDDSAVVLQESGYCILDSRWLTPYHKDHAALVCTKDNRCF